MKLVALGISFFLSLACAGTATAQLGPAAYPTVGRDHWSYRGAFRVPLAAGIPAEEHFSYGGHALCHRPASNSLFMAGHAWYQKLAEIDVPSPAICAEIDDLPRANLRQSLHDVADGHLAQLGPGGSPMDGAMLGGLLAHGDRLVGSAFVYYDAGGEAERSHFSSGFDLSDPSDFAGMFRLDAPNPGFLAGYVAAVPAEWQPLLGGPLLSGQCGLPIVSRGSWGPSAFAFDPSLFGVSNPVPARPLVFYDAEHPTLGEWGNQTHSNHLFNMSPEVHGAVFPAGSRTLILFGRQGLGVPCYGQGTDDPSLHLQPVPGEDGVVFVYDPAEGGKGTHSWPYAYFAWAFDAADLARAAAGSCNPWDVVPSATWQIDLPWASHSSAHRLGGAAWDPSSRTLFLSQLLADDGLPIVHVFQLVLPWDSGHQPLGGGWRRLPWFGDFVPMGPDGWIWHHRHGFFFAPPSNSPDSIFLFAQDLGWLWTSAAAYPFLYRFSDHAWLWYNGQTNPRWFVDVSTGRWESLP